ncbi:MAG: hypothetical protein ACKV2Q_23680 [Planctomycetaceae bacterium]
MVPPHSAYRGGRFTIRPTRDQRHPKKRLLKTMTENERPGEIFEIEPTPSGRHWHVPWWLLLAVAIFVTELTAHPAIGVAVFCLKFGLNDWRTAAWLCRVDPQPQRSHTIWWFLLGSGFLKIFLISFIAFPMLAGFWTVVTDQPVQKEVEIAVTIGIGGMLLSFVVNHVGLFLASRRHVRIWLNRRLHLFRDSEAWPVRLSRPNHLRDILNGSALPAILAFAVGLIFLIVFGLQNMIRPALTSAVVVVVSCLILLGHAISVKRVVARTSEECWGDLPVLEAEDS